MIKNKAPFFLLSPQHQELFLSLPLSEVEVLKRSCGHLLPRWVKVSDNWYDMSRFHSDLTPRMKLMIGKSYDVTHSCLDDSSLITSEVMELKRIDLSILNSPVYSFVSDAGVIELTPHMITFIKPKADNNG